MLVFLANEFKQLNGEFKAEPTPELSLAKLWLPSHPQPGRQEPAPSKILNETMQSLIAITWHFRDGGEHLIFH